MFQFKKMFSESYDANPFISDVFCFVVYLRTPPNTPAARKPKCCEPMDDVRDISFVEHRPIAIYSIKHTHKTLLATNFCGVSIQIFDPPPKSAECCYISGRLGLGKVKLRFYNQNLD